MNLDLNQFLVVTNTSTILGFNVLRSGFVTCPPVLKANSEATIEIEIARRTRETRVKCDINLFTFHHNNTLNYLLVI